MNTAIIGGIVAATIASIVGYFVGRPKQRVDAAGVVSGVALELMEQMRGDLALIKAENATIRAESTANHARVALLETDVRQLRDESVRDNAQYRQSLQRMYEAIERLGRHIDRLEEMLRGVQIDPPPRPEMEPPSIPTYS